MLLWELLNEQARAAREAINGTSSHPARVARLPFDKRCSAIAKSGRRCRGRIHSERGFCIFHDPAVIEARRRALAARRGGRQRQRLARLPDGYLRRLTRRPVVGEAMDRLYREVRLGVVTPEMGQVLFAILTRLLDSGACDRPGQAPRAPGRSRAERIRPKLRELLTEKERRAWRRAVANAPASFVRREELGGTTTGTAQSVEDAPGQLVLPAAS